ncbi:MAG: hypothetical protein RIQ47_440, partial [Bacteroidota bacterium]
MIKRVRISAAWFLLLGIVSLFIAGVVGVFPGMPPTERVKEAEQILRDQDKQLFALLSDCSKDSSNFHSDVLHATNRFRGMSLFVFNRDELVNWSDNEPCLDDVRPDTLVDASVLQLPNGKYWCRLIRKGSITYVGLYLIRHEYNYENRYLTSGFNPAFQFTELVSSGVPLDFHSPNGIVIDRLQLSTSSHLPLGERWYLLLWLSGMILLFTSSYFILRRKRFRLRFTVAALVLLARAAMLYMHFPSGMYNTSIFDPAIYASSAVFQSLGDFFLNGLVILYICLLLFPQLSHSRISRTWAAFVSIGISAVVLIILDYLIEGLVADSHISFSIEDLAAVDFHTFVGLLALSLYFLTGGVIVYSFLKRYTASLSARHAFISLVLITVFTSWEFYTYNNQKEVSQRMQIAQRVGVQRDPSAEYFLQSILSSIVQPADSLSSDSLLLTAFASELSTRLSKDYLARFEAMVYRFNGSGESYDGTENLNDFIRVTADQGEQLVPSGIYLLPAQAGRVQYVAVQSVLRAKDDTLGTLAISIRSRTIGSGQGFPELFVGGNYRVRNIPEQYSYASYRNGSLEYEFGSFPYSFSAADFLLNGAVTIRHLSKDEYDHLVIKSSPESIVVVSKPTSTWMSAITLFSWLFTFFSVIWWAIVLLHRMLESRSLTGSLTRRIRVSVFLMVVLSFLGIGTGTILYIFKKYNSDQHRTVAEQLNGLWVLLGENAAVGDPLSLTAKESLPLDLQRIAANTNFDFNIFDETGRLYYSSQPRIFDQEIISFRMNPEAYHELNEFQRTQFIHRESVGKLEYIAGYAPFVGANGKMTGYLHLPYFEKQQERNREISGFLSALLNIYVLLFALAVFLTAFVSSRITQPLSLIQERLAGMRFGRKSEPIVYAAKDEIGQLVVEYNRMLKELADSADKLARSERETAWREMAKQVAHEIKNPLTPMKLSVQQLQRAWKDHRDDREAMTQKMAQTLIQQIDTLSAIATEFSNFAKMPQANPVELDLNAILASTISLFSSSSTH